MPKKILFAINDLSFGGGQRAVVAEANGFLRKGYNVYVLTLRTKSITHDLTPSLKIPVDHITNIPFRSFFDFGAWKRLIKFLKAIRPDFVFSNLFFTNTILRVSKFFFFRMQIIVREGNVPVEKSLKIKIIDFVLSFLTTKIIVNATAIKYAFRGLLPQKKIEVIYNGIDEKFFEPIEDGSVLRDSLGIPADTLVLLTIASLTKKKGHQFLIQAAAELKNFQFPITPDRKIEDPRQSRDNFQLLIVGSGPEGEKLELQATSYKLQANVRFLGARSDIRELLNIADIFVLPSLWEGMPNVMLEAMAAGLPVIVTSAGGVREIVQSGNNGIVVEPKNPRALADAIAKLWENPKLRSQLAQKAKESVRGMTWDKHVNQLMGIIKSK